VFECDRLLNRKGRHSCAIHSRSLPQRGVS
jgi:hypothetical protein